MGASPASEGGGIADETALAALVDRLDNRLGLGAVRRLAPYESHLPERAIRPLPPFATVAPTLQIPLPPRPARLLPVPEPVEATAPVPDDPPILFRWRRRLHRVRRAEGPERIAAEWWRQGTDGLEAIEDLRDYYRVEDETGRRFWLYRAGLYRPDRAARWFLHGVFA